VVTKRTSADCAAAPAAAVSARIVEEKSGNRLFEIHATLAIPRAQF
jgi:hypothetical protein